MKVVFYCSEDKKLVNNNCIENRYCRIDILFVAEWFF
jgi:hypothetical protein